jgi:hypothetical protein
VNPKFTVADMHDYFNVRDVIEITNADRPAWAKGKWRVKSVAISSVLLQPLNDDLSVDVERDKRREYVIELGGITERQRTN